MRLRTLLVMATALVAAIVIAAVGTLLVLSRTGAEAAAYIVISVESVEIAQQLRIDVAALEARGSRPGSNDALIDRRLARARALVQSPDEAAIVDALERRVADLRAELLARATPERLARAAEAAGGAAQALVSINLAQARQADAEVSAKMRTAARVALWTAVALVLAFALVMAWGHARLLRPLLTLRDRIRAALLGGPPLPQADAPHELREVAETLDAILAAIDQRRSERLELLKAIAADIATPLEQVASTAALGGQRAAANGPVEPRTLHAIGREGTRLQRLLTEYLEVARIQEGEIAVGAEVVDLCEVAAEAVELFRPLAPSHQLRLDCPATPQPVSGGRAILARTLNSLLSFAVRHPPATGQVVVTVRPEEGEVRLTVSSRWADAVPFERLFVALHGLDQAVLTVPGNRFSISTSRRVVEALGGQLKVDAQPEGIEFELRLPIRRLGLVGGLG